MSEQPTGPSYSSYDGSGYSGGGGSADQSNYYPTAMPPGQGFDPYSQGEQAYLPQVYSGNPYGAAMDPHAPVAHYPVPTQPGYAPNPMAGMVTPYAPFGFDPISGLPYSDKSKLAAGLLQIFLGAFGVGRFYMGSIGIAIGQLAVTVVTLGALGWVWPLIDGIVILAGRPTDSNGLPLR